MDWGGLSTILVEQAKLDDPGTRLTAIRWLKEFVVIAKEALLPHYPEILGAVLPCMSNPNEDICQVCFALGSKCGFQLSRGLDAGKSF